MSLKRLDKGADDMSKGQVHYQLDEGIRDEIRIVKNTILTYLSDAQIYLFGSIAKGCYSKTSDIDVLILLPDSLESKALRSLRHKLEDKIEEYGLSRQVDMKLYSANRYKELCQTPCFEQCIQNDLVCIVDW